MDRHLQGVAVRSLAALWLCGSCGGGGGGGDPPDPPVTVTTANPILFVTQVPTPFDFLTVASTFGNHLGRPKAAPRGGDLWIRYGDGTLKNLTALAGFGLPDGDQTGDGIAVREPCVHWNGQKAVFSMVDGTPGPGDTEEYFWQLYEVFNLGQSQTPSIFKVPNQPSNANNTSPCYSSDGRILFASDRPHNGAAHLRPQLDEYEEAPTNTGLWSLDPQSGALFLMNHAPSGSFKPVVDSFGRVVFTRWDHLERDQQTDLELMGQGVYATFNYSDESASAVNTGSNLEVFPEPRTQWIAFVNQEIEEGGYSGPLNGWEDFIVGNAANHFFPWTINQDGTGEETLNHIGRQELFQNFPKSRIDDPNIKSHFLASVDVANVNPIANLMQLRESPLIPGAYLGIDAREFETHASGQVVMILAPASLNADEVEITYVTHRDTHTTSLNPSPNHSGLYRNPLPLGDGQIVVTHTPETKKDENVGTAGAPLSTYDLRLKLLEQQGQYWVAATPLTDGIEKVVEYWDPFNHITYDGELWELDPVEVVARPIPPAMNEPPVPAPEMAALAGEGVTVSALRSWLRNAGVALVVSRNVTTRDDNDLQQPYNLRVAGTSTTTTGAPGTVYDVEYLQFFQGDLIRGLAPGGGSPVVGRRVLAQPLHDPTVNNPPNPSGPEGSVVLGDDGSMAALVPARRAMAWQLVGPAGEPVVRERYWITFQPGEIRSCTSCHGLNDASQAGGSVPTNTPQALTTLLQYLKTQGL